MPPKAINKLTLTSQKKVLEKSKARYSSVNITLLSLHQAISFKTELVHI